MIIETLIGGMVGGIIPAGISIFYSHRQFTTQRWWEKKADEYLRIIREISEYGNCCARIAGSAANIESDEDDQKLKCEEKKRRDGIRGTCLAGSILISDKANIMLSKLVRVIDNNKFVEAFARYWENSSEQDEIIKLHAYAIDETIKELQKIAKKDLNLEQKTWGIRIKEWAIKIWGKFGFKHQKKIAGILLYAGVCVIGLMMNGKCGWEYRVNGENPPQAISDAEMILPNGPIEWKISRTIRLRDPQGKIEAEARGLECKINNVATTSIVVNCNNANEQQEMKTKYEGKTYKFMLGCMSNGK